jgi:hypothetical protein
LALFESDWCWCNQCQALLYNGSAWIGHCPNKGAHRPVPNSDPRRPRLKMYRLSRRGGAGETGWKWCQYGCQGLFWNGDGNTGVCPKGGGHDQSNGSVYTLPLTRGASQSEGDWQRCKACRVLYWGGIGSPAGICPANSAGHDSGQQTYYLNYDE